MTVRQFFVFDPQVINEQQCREDALELIAADEEDEVRIHKHKNGEWCSDEMFFVTNIREQLAHIPANRCYCFRKDTR
jgi:hypothetical protein